MSESINILVVEDDKNAAYLLVENLRLSKYNVVLADDGDQGLDMFTKSNFNLCILDIMLPRRDGLDLANEIRSINPKIPIIFLTARTLSSDIIEGFKAGCDDYITKPYNIDELLWRVKAILRRKDDSEKKTVEGVYKYPNFSFKYSERDLDINGNLFSLSTKEADILKCLADNLDQTISRNTIMEHVWGNDDYFTSKSLDVYLTKIRKYLSKADNIKLINIHGHGYKLMITSD
ncbi:MAG: DNA-binding response regulator [Bacteroidetes bacterium]|nr:MAG: DNA-binding response regulator [Bacteroidota bacterium]